MNSIKNKLKESYGYISASQLNNVMQEFGEDLEVVVKYWTGQRELMPICEIETLPLSKSKEICQVFISAETYEQLFGSN